MTARGQALFDTTKPLYGPRSVPVAESNDPVNTCDPQGFPRILFLRSPLSGMEFIRTPDRMLQVFYYQHVLREIWTDGRALPKAVDVRGAPESRYYGYSVGHWENDTTFVVDTTGLDERAWLDEAGHPRSAMARIQERYTRTDQYNLQLTVTVDDAKYYTKPWTFMRANFYWMKAQDFAETLCIPSEAIEYRDTLAKPSGIEIR